MRSLSRYRHIAWVAVIALMAQSWLVPFATVAAAARLNAVTICTGTGFKVILLPDDAGLPSDGQPGHAEQSPDCAACLVQALGKAGMSAEPEGMLWQRPEALEPLAPARQPLMRPGHSPLQSRAPPVS